MQLGNQQSFNVRETASLRDEPSSQRRLLEAILTQNERVMNCGCAKSLAGSRWLQSNLMLYRDPGLQTRIASMVADHL
jgi:hypothetical protein